MTNISRVKLGDFEVNDRIRKLVARALESGRISYGPLCGEFEARFSLMHDSLYGVLSNSGTSALQVSLQAMKELYKWDYNDEVIIPATTFVATANIVLHNNMRPVFVDVDPLTFAIDVEKIERAITPRTRCIIPVHPFGLVADMEKITTLARQYDLKVIEDSAESMFVSHKNRKVGSWGDIGCFSFYVAHIMTMGVGGISISRDEELILKMRSLVNHGIELSSLPDASFYDNSHLGRHFRFTSIGHSFRVTELEAALGVAQLDDLPNIIQNRQNTAAAIEAMLEPLIKDDVISIQEIPEGTEHAYMVYPIVSTKMKNSRIIETLRELGIEVREALPLIDQPCYKNLNIAKINYPVASHLLGHAYYVPCHQYLNPYDIEYMCDAILYAYGYSEKPV